MRPSCLPLDVLGRSSVALTLLISGALWGRPETLLASPIRGAYFYASLPADHLNALAGAAFNTGLVKVVDLAWSPALLADLAAKRARADSLGIDLFITLNFHNARLLRDRCAPERRFRDRGGIVHPGIPCPADTAYWCGLLEEMVLPVARTLARPARIALDLELYSDLSHYPPGPCTCTDCRLDYTGYTGVNRPLAATWIDHLPLGDLEDLERAEREWVVGILVGELAAIERVTGGPLELAVLDLGRPGLPNRALLQAFSRLGLAVIDFTELSYEKGSGTPSAEIQLAYTPPPTPVATVGGLWLAKWSPSALETEAVNLARQGAGYWIFTSASLALPPAQLSGPYTLRGPREEYWQALERANRRLAAGN